MIFVNRGAEPDFLRLEREKCLAFLRALGREPMSAEFGTGYTKASKLLFDAQDGKCCYCERLLLEDYNDVEHYRPKARARRTPGCTARHGYWWLAYTWENLLFACSTCNRSRKRDWFPLAEGSTSLRPEEPAPGAEIPLLLDPASEINPVEHIEFVFGPLQGGDGKQGWLAQPRDGSLLGNATIRVCGLNANGQIEIRGRQFEDIVSKFLDPLAEALSKGNAAWAEWHYQRALGIFESGMPFAAFNYNALRFHISDAKLQDAIQKTWPAPREVGLRA